ncbi:DEDD exonuclease domain-containing protein [Actinobaculum suis]|uniref:DEDD exonuclease domain-containing protein n=1 Tax=Actinobaculum suis TaxID=1657 RepID=UPI00080867E2|nr:DEDD exonuclease domain-containing protein [Actinobaculum suis]OCA93921.1 DNA polymerase III subunit epsilon [Actinobaculum suis]OCA94386.1 DNA polymerase III subunit epsilon [Actinobaculum suis]
MRTGRASRKDYLDLDPARIHREGAAPPAPEQLTFTDLGPELNEVTFIVVDLETTGNKPGLHAITEIGAVKTRGGETVSEFSTLVNPEVPVPAFIASLTGITTAMTVTAPKIAAALPAFLDFVDPDSRPVLVAHNARFDIGHLRGAAQVLGLDFPSLPVLDTLPLARRVFTREEVPNYKLGTLAGFCRATHSPSHRALADARATVDVLYTILGRLGPRGVTHIADLFAASNPVPAHRRRRAYLADGLPKGPGVYHFLGPRGEVLYVGTSKNVYKRVRQYFTAAETRGRMAEMVDLAQKVEAFPTATAVEAAVVELRHIEKYDPPYNRRSRRPNSQPWLVLDRKPRTGEPHIRVARGIPDADIENCLGPFFSGAAARRAKELICLEAGLREGGLQIPRATDFSDSPCTIPGHVPGSAPGQCVLPPRGTANPVEVASRRAAQILAGDVASVWEHHLALIRKLAAAENFEQAAIERDRLAALMGAARRREKLLPLWRSSRIIAARRRDSGWEIAVICWERLTAASFCADAARPALPLASPQTGTRTNAAARPPAGTPADAAVRAQTSTAARAEPSTAARAQTRVPAADNPRQAQLLAQNAELVDRPERAAGLASSEETEILANWLADPRTRILEHIGTMPLGVPVQGAARFRLPANLRQLPRNK